MDKIKSDLFVMALTDLNADVERGLQEMNILKRKLSQIVNDQIEFKKIILKGKKFIETIEIEYTKNGEAKKISLSRNDFYSLGSL